jgi:hypothetical protein
MFEGKLAYKKHRNKTKILKLFFMLDGFEKIKGDLLFFGSV